MRAEGSKQGDGPSSAAAAISALMLGDQQVRRALRPGKAGAGRRHWLPAPEGAYTLGRAGSRPDFLILAYPVISFDPAITHAGSVRSLLGENPDPRLISKTCPTIFA
jgi:hypothetical protein